MITRREFVARMAAAGICLGVPSSGCARKCRAKVRIAIAGGGAAGISIAARLVRRLPEAEILLFDAADRNYYQPGLTLVAAGVYKPSDIWKFEAACIPRGVRWIKKNILAVDPVKKHITVEGGGKHEYDFMVLCPGLVMDWDALPGIDREHLGVGNAHTIYDFAGAQATRDAMSAFAKSGGKGVFVDTWTKHKCGGAPKKVCLLTEHLLRKSGNRAKADMRYFTASKQLYDVPYYTPRLEEIYRERNIPVTLRTKVKGIDTAAKKVHFVQTDAATGEEKEFAEEYDFCHFVPPQCAPRFVKESGLGWREGKLAAGGWAEVDKNTLVHAVFPDIVALGDVAGIPTSKTSAAVRKQVPVALENLLCLIEGKEPAAKYDGYAACPIVTDYGHVLLCEFDYEKKPRTSFPFTMFDTSRELRSAWWLKVYGLKKLYFQLMLRGLDFM